MIWMKLTYGDPPELIELNPLGIVDIEATSLGSRIAYENGSFAHVNESPGEVDEIKKQAERDIPETESPQA